LAFCEFACTSEASKDRGTRSCERVGAIESVRLIVNQKGQTKVERKSVSIPASIAAVHPRVLPKFSSSENTLDISSKEAEF
jgi:hypothetical protein